jgi:hypothetical protein
MDLWWEPRSVYRGIEPEELFSGTGAVGSVPKPAAALMRSIAAAIPILWTVFMADLL